jgi:hypothetical protein
MDVHWNFSKPNDEPGNAPSAESRKSADSQSITASKPQKHDKNAPSIRSVDLSVASFDIDQWLSGSRALAEKYDDLLVQLDALLFQIDCCLGSVTADDAQLKLESSLVDIGRAPGSIKRSLITIDSAIKGARTVASELSDSQEKTDLLELIQRVEKKFKLLKLGSSSPVLLSRSQNLNPSGSDNGNDESETSDSTTANSATDNSLLGDENDPN